MDWWRGNTCHAVGSAAVLLFGHPSCSCIPCQIPISIQSTDHSKCFWTTKFSNKTTQTHIEPLRSHINRAFQTIDHPPSHYLQQSQTTRLRLSVAVAAGRGWRQGVSGALWRLGPMRHRGGGGGGGGWEETKLTKTGRRRWVCRV